MEDQEDAGSDEARRRKQGVADSGGDNCGKCKVEVKKKDNAIMCDLCKKWFHAGCGKCSLSLYKVLKEEEDQLWFCPACKPNMVQACAEVKRLREENTMMKKQMQELREKYDELTENFKKSEEGWKLKEEGLVNKAVKEAVVKMEKLLDKSERQREEKEDRERRRKNLIVFNMPESDKQLGKDREKEDVERCDLVFNNILQVEGCKIEKVFRLGKKQEGKIRPTLVKLEEEHSKWHIISKAKNLKQEEDEVIKRLIIALDMTPQQREEDFKLRQELRRKREEGESCYIKKGKIVSNMQMRNVY